MLPMPAHTRALLVGALLLAMGGCAEKRRAQPIAIDGIIDLSDWDFEKDGIVELKGEWRFVWEEFVEPMPSAVFREKYKGTIEVPAVWPGLPHPSPPQCRSPSPDPLSTASAGASCAVRHPAS